MDYCEERAWGVSSLGCSLLVGGDSEGVVLWVSRITDQGAGAGPARPNRWPNHLQTMLEYRKVKTTRIYIYTHTRYI